MKIIKDRTNFGPRVPNLSQDNDILNIHCDLVSDSLVEGEESADIICSFSTSVLRPSFSFTLETKRVTFHPINKNTISSVKIYITDGKRRVIDLNEAGTSSLSLDKYILFVSIFYLPLPGVSFYLHQSFLKLPWLIFYS